MRHHSVLLAGVLATTLTIAPGCDLQPALSGSSTTLVQVSTRGVLKVRFGGDLAALRTQATVDDIHRVVTSVTVGDDARMATTLRAQLLDAQASATFQDMPVGTGTVAVEVLSADDLILGEATASVELTAGNTTTADMAITLVPTLTNARAEALVTTIAISDGQSFVNTGAVSLVAGATNGSYGSTDATGSVARFWSPKGIVFDAAGNAYVGDSANHRIRKVTPEGGVTTFAGSTSGFTDAAGTEAQFDQPHGLAIDRGGNLYVADKYNHRIRKISPEGDVTTLAGSGNEGFADGAGTAAHFADPEGVAVDRNGNVYVADRGNHRIRKITSAGVVTTLAGSGAIGLLNGAGSAARFDGPTSLAVDSAGNVFVADALNHVIRKITPTGVVTTLAGTGTSGFADGEGASAQFKSPGALAINSNGVLFVADLQNYRVRKVARSGAVSTVAGNGTSSSMVDGVGTLAQFTFPRGIGVSATGLLYVADNQTIRKIQ